MAGTWRAGVPKKSVPRSGGFLSLRSQKRKFESLDVKETPSKKKLAAKGATFINLSAAVSYLSRYKDEDKLAVPVILYFFLLFLESRLIGS
jgi:hypothetical protein